MVVAQVIAQHYSPKVMLFQGWTNLLINMADKHRSWCCRWLTDRPRTSALLWMVITAFCNSLLLQLKYRSPHLSNEVPVSVILVGIFSSLSLDLPFCHYVIGQFMVSRRIFVCQWRSGRASDIWPSHWSWVRFIAVRIFEIESNRIP